MFPGKIKKSRSLVSMLPLFCLIFLTAAAAQDNSKLKPEEIVARHVASIGPPEILLKSQNRVFEGQARAMDVRSSLTNVEGKAALASTADRFLLRLNFEVVTPGDYAGEQISFDGKKVSVPLITESQRSALGTFIFEYDDIVKSGLFGGSLNASWALLDAKDKFSRLKFDGKDRIDKKEVLVLKVTPRGSAALNIKLFFEADTFRHIRTVYQHTALPSGIYADEGRNSETSYKLIEDFADFKEINGLMLPSAYKITYMLQTQSRQREFQWLINLRRFGLNQQLPADYFP